MLGLVAMAPAASAVPDGTVLDQWRWQSWATGGYLDHNPADGVHTRAENRGPHQWWEVTRYSDGTLRFMNVATKMCLDNSEHGVRGFGCNDGPWQRWRTGSWGTTYELVSMWNNHCLDNSHEGVRTMGCNGLAYQRWR
ncbi:hypothetical protein BN6_11300 [Saccharothrix espanaensis DSM 44229]|uniref:Ricin B lectin domain-containing protein n=1 Tax=Saccharothrix espanaensis (strain ATCC 51144 / DSM 44229 / JCM 9112 / NBRC 15066 / NRRL 15764) TaxID=1179773 RepID=K0JRP1_SACES|nr:hypothetical protein BN6_11300 [Saccharothrix espanaensis DSM 44229]